MVDGGVRAIGEGVVVGEYVDGIVSLQGGVVVGEYVDGIISLQEVGLSEITLCEARTLVDIGVDCFVPAVNGGQNIRS